MWRRSACTLCPASPSTTRTATDRPAARPKPQVGAATVLSAPPLPFPFSSTFETIPRPARILAVISSALQPALPAQASSFPPCHLVPISTLKTEQTPLIPKKPQTQGHTSLFSSGCYVDLTEEQIQGLLPFAFFSL